EPEDDIEIIIDKSKQELSYLFSGKGAAKFDLRWHSDLQGYSLNREAIQRGYGNRFGDLKTKIKIADSISQLQLNSLEIVKDDLPFEVYQIMKADIYGQNGIDLKPFSYYMGLNQLSKAELEDYRILFSQSMVSDLPDSILAQSPNYLLFLSNMLIAQLQLEHPNDPSYHLQNIYSNNFSDLCSVIRTNYTGALREKLLLYNLLSLKVQDT
ncbi:hypothetical protein Q4566_17035, partial [Tamlana sp. 2_MG-2023]|uniref:hypothetical protein n=1 Tax=unclassified Tamlana TaxID=2614803 RepID=UPI0026E37F3B